MYNSNLPYSPQIIYSSGLKAEFVLESDNIGIFNDYLKEEYVGYRYFCARDVYNPSDPDVLKWKRGWYEVKDNGTLATPRFTWELISEAYDALEQLIKLEDSRYELNAAHVGYRAYLLTNVYSEDDPPVLLNEKGIYEIQEDPANPGDYIWVRPKDLNPCIEILTKITDTQYPLDAEHEGYRLYLCNDYSEGGVDYYKGFYEIKETETAGIFKWEKVEEGEFMLIGDIAPWTGTINDKVDENYGVPAGWLLCNGKDYLISEYPDLYDVIGTKYGGGSGFFNVPNIDSRIPNIIRATPSNIFVPSKVESHALDVHSNVNIYAPSNGHVLTYMNGVWKNVAVPDNAKQLGDLTDVTVENPQLGQTIVYDGDKWVNQPPTLPEHGIEDHTGIECANKWNKDYLGWDTAAGEWKNMHPTVSMMDGHKIEFGIDADGNWGYRKEGTGEVIPFKSGGMTPEGTYEITYNGIHDISSYEFADVKVPTSDTFKMNPVRGDFKGHLGAIIVPTGEGPITIKVYYKASFPGDGRRFYIDYAASEIDTPYIIKAGRLKGYTGDQFIPDCPSSGQLEPQNSGTYEQYPMTWGYAYLISIPKYNSAGAPTDHQVVIYPHFSEGLAADRCSITIYGGQFKRWIDW